jgi:hypothetical protein
MILKFHTGKNHSQVGRTTIISLPGGLELGRGTPVKETGIQFIVVMQQRTEKRKLGAFQIHVWFSPKGC